MNFSKTLLDWYKKNKRDLPWRQTSDPYKIWLSEIILQQTRIDQGLQYYLNIINHYPDIYSIAAASEMDILKLWQGLGYYSRARNLHLTAKKIVQDLNGRFPDNYHDLIQLKGIGEYTAAAISSIANHEPQPVVDGNVMRFLSRLYGITTPINTNAAKRQILEKALQLIDKKRPGDFNQAMMEFGALQCKPQNPDCRICIFKADCMAFLQNKVSAIPVKAKPIPVRKRYFYYLFIIYKDQSVYMHKRTGNDIWRNLYDFPLIEKNSKIKVKSMTTVLEQTGIKELNDLLFYLSDEYKHILTHQHIIARFVTIPLNNLKQFREIGKAKCSHWEAIGLKKINQLPIPRLIEKFLKNKKYL